MRRHSLAAALGLLAAIVTMGSIFAQAAPQFVLGFKTLADLIPNVAGQPIESERHNPQNGDALQQTTTGLMVWRKADNWTAFTNGSQSWLNGPFGLQTRPNNVRFDWEGPDRPNALPDGSVSISFGRAVNGTWVGRGTVTNPLSETMDAEIDVVALAAPNGQPLMDAPSAFVGGISPGSTRSFSVNVPTTRTVGAWRWIVASVPSSARPGYFKDVGISRGLNLDTVLAGAVDALNTIADGSWLLRVAAEHGVGVGVGPLPSGVLGLYDSQGNTVTISTSLGTASAWARATVLSHELQHAADAAAGNLPTSSQACYNFEGQAFQRQATIWSQFWQNNLPPNVDALHAEFNDVATTIANNPRLFARELLTKYHAECATPRQ